MAFATESEIKLGGGFTGYDGRSEAGGLDFMTDIPLNSIDNAAYED